LVRRKKERIGCEVKRMAWLGGEDVRLGGEE